MDITSLHTAPLTLPNGQVVPPRGSIVVKDWADIKDNFVVKAWLTEKKLTRDKLPFEEVQAVGDTPAIAEMRKRFEDALAQANGTISTMQADIVARDAAIKDLKAELDAAKSAVPNGERNASPEQEPGFTVKEKSPGWFVVLKGDLEATKSLRRGELQDFDAMSEQDKAAFVDLHKAEV